VSLCSDPSLAPCWALFRWGVAHALEEAQNELQKSRVDSTATEQVTAQVTAALKGRLP
jgi:hypothetical protein